MMMMRFHLPVRQTCPQGGSWGSRPWWSQYSPWSLIQFRQMSTMSIEHDDYDVDDNGDCKDDDLSQGQSDAGPVVDRQVYEADLYWGCVHVDLEYAEDDDNDDNYKQDGSYDNNDDCTHRTTALAKRSVRHAEHIGKGKTEEKFVYMLPNIYRHHKYHHSNHHFNHNSNQHYHHNQSLHSR